MWRKSKRHSDIYDTPASPSYKFTDAKHQASYLDTWVKNHTWIHKTKDRQPESSRKRQYCTNSQHATDAFSNTLVTKKKDSYLPFSSSPPPLPYSHSSSTCFSSNFSAKTEHEHWGRARNRRSECLPWCRATEAAAAPRITELKIQSARGGASKRQRPSIAALFHTLSFHLSHASDCPIDVHYVSLSFSLSFNLTSIPGPERSIWGQLHSWFEQNTPIV